MEFKRNKNNIKDNLINLLNKIKQKILPRKKLKFEKEKLPKRIWNRITVVLVLIILIPLIPWALISSYFESFNEFN